MKCGILKIVASLLLFGYFALAPSVQSSADDKKALPKDVKLACTQHGPANMTFILSPEEGKARELQVSNSGTDTDTWFLTIDKGKQVVVANGSTVKVHREDSITWSVVGAARMHGVVFADQDLANALLDIDKKASKQLKDQSGLGRCDPEWKKFGPKLWGTDAFKGDVVLISCKVKKF